MKIFLNKEQVGDIPFVIWRDKQRILSYLWGIHYTDDHGKGVYRTVLQIWRAPGQLFIELPNYLMILMSRFPYIHIERATGLELGE